MTMESINSWDKPWEMDDIQSVNGWIQDDDFAPPWLKSRMENNLRKSRNRKVGKSRQKKSL